MPDGEATKAANAKAPAGSPLTKYFLVVLFGCSCLSMVVNNKFASTVHLHGESNVVGSVLRDSLVSNSKIAKRKKIMEEGTATEPPEDDANGDDKEEGNGLDEPEGDDDGNENKEKDDDELHDPNEIQEEQRGLDDDVEGVGDDDNKEQEQKQDENGEKHRGDHFEQEQKRNQKESQKQDHIHMEHSIANLNCEAYGGPSNEEASEMVYWEDIPKDAQHMSPFHIDHPENDKATTSITQYLTFEPDAGGWNNIRMAMETVLTLAFAMGRTLVLPPHQGMYLLGSNENKQNNKFSFDHFFHMESISNEHIGLDIITTKEFLERCAKGKVLDAEGKPIYPPNMRTEWDGAPFNEMRDLKMWIREHSGENLLHWDPDNCIAAFPGTNSDQDSKELESLPDEINEKMGHFPGYDKYIGKPNPVDAPPMERLAEMNADRERLCIYTPELQKKQWIHFPVGMKTKEGDESRLLVHFYAFLFFQDWKQDLWMKRFVRDHVRYIDEIQCAAARVVTAIRKRVKERTQGKSDEFDTIHIRRGDFQYKDTRVDADKILKQLKRKLDDTTTLYIATDERDKSFFKDITDYYPQVIFLDDVLDEIKGVNTNYYGMIDQLVASRGRTFFGCWFSTFTGYINRLRGYHADDHETPGYEMGVIPSYYYAMPDRFDHLQEYWPIKKQFYAREFPASWRLIDSSI